MRTSLVIFPSLVDRSGLLRTIRRPQPAGSPAGSDACVAGPGAPPHPSSDGIVVAPPAPSHRPSGDAGLRAFGLVPSRPLRSTPQSARVAMRRLLLTIAMLLMGMALVGGAAV